MHPTRIFKTPDELLKAWEEYKSMLIEQAKEWPRIQYVGKDGERVEDYPKLPLVKDGFQVWCFKNYGTVEHYFRNTDGYYEEFCTICSHISKEIKADQITGGMLGVYNASITQRLNGLTDKSEVVHKEQPLFPDDPNV
jgi:hypothetical protein